MPSSSNQVNEVSSNYAKYDDNANNISIKTFSVINLNDINGSQNAGEEIGQQLGENAGENITYNNITLFNKSGTYTYFKDGNNSMSMIIIITNNLDMMMHIVNSIKEPQLNITPEDYNNSNITLTADSDVNASTNGTTVSVKSKTSSSSKNSGNDGYKWSPQDQAYIKEYTDSNGIQHIDRKGGDRDSYNPKTGIMTTRTRDGQVYSFSMD